MTEAEVGTAPRRRLPASERRQRIESAAVAVFAERGYDAAVLGEVAGAAGVTRSVLYDHFPDKRRLFLHVLAAENTAMLAQVADGITGAGDGRDRMRATIAAYLGYTRDRPAGRRLLVDPVPSGDPELDQVIRGYRDARTQVVTTLLAPDLARAGITGPAVPAVVEVLVSGVDGAARWWGDHPEVPQDEVVESVLRLLWQGLPRYADLSC